MNWLKRNLTLLAVLLSFSFLTAVSFSACQNAEEEDTEQTEEQNGETNGEDQEGDAEDDTSESEEHPAGGEHPE